jgi:hypothetical protein
VAQLFRPGANTIARLFLLALLVAPLGAAVVAGVWVRSGQTTGEGRFVEQIVPFSHKHHAGELGIDCRYCHTGVETGAQAVVPPTKTCMTCHSQLWTNAGLLAPIRRSMATGEKMRWSRVHRTPDYVYFDHHVHVNNGVPCAACHGAVRSMPLTAQATPMTMRWCLDCHRDPGGRLVPAARVYDDDPRAAAWTQAEIAEVHAKAAAARGRNLTDCSTCHR